MSQVIEVPGMGNVEFPDEMSEKDIADAIDSQLAQQHQAKMSNASAMDVGTAMAIPAAAAAVPRVAQAVPAVAQGAQTVGKIATPAYQAATDLAKTYWNKPGAAFTDIALGHMGLPPINAAEAAKTGVQGTYDQLRDWRNNTGQFTPKPTNTQFAQNAATAATQQTREQSIINAVHQHLFSNPNDFADFQQHAGNPEAMAQVAQQKGIDIPGVTKTPPVGGQPAQQGVNFLENIAQKYGQVSSKIGQMGTAIAENPMVKGVAKVAGPIINNPVTRFAAGPIGTGIQAATYSPNTGPAVPSTGRLRGSEINPFTHAPWTPEALQAYNANPQKYDAQLPGPVAPR